MRRQRVTGNFRALLGGVAGLFKSGLLLVGVPITVIRLWLISALPPSPYRLAELARATTWIHLVLIAVAVLWVAASHNLVRDLMAAFRQPLESRTPSWSARWASSIAGLLLVAGIGSTVVSSNAVAHKTMSAEITQVSTHQGTSVQHRADAPDTPITPTSRSVPVIRTVLPGECLADVANADLGGTDEWPTLARWNMNLPVAAGTRLSIQICSGRDGALRYRRTQNWWRRRPVPITDAPHRQRPGDASPSSPSSASGCSRRRVSCAGPTCSAGSANRVGDRVSGYRGRHEI